MISLILVIGYMMIGSVFARLRITDMAIEAGDDENIINLVAIALKWSATWPMWIGK